MSASKDRVPLPFDAKANFTNTQDLTIRLHQQGHGINKYPAKSHARRVAHALGVPSGLIVLQATSASLYPNSDQPIPFRQDRYFYYLTGCNETGCWATYDIESDHLVLWLPPIDKRRVVWTGRGSTVEEALEKYDVDDAQYLRPPRPPPGLAAAADSTPSISYRLCNTALQPCINAWVRDPDFVRLRRPEGPDKVYFSLNPLQGGDSVSKPIAPYRDERSVKPAINACRVIKDEYEIDLIRKANGITAAAHKNVLMDLHHCTSEADVEAAYMDVCISRGARVQAYAPIAGSGPNAAELHYDKNDELFVDRQMLVLDAGCEWERYASDVTRTMPLNKKRPGHWPSKECEQIYELVEKVQEACICKMKPGNKFTEIVKLADQIAIDRLLELGILKGKKEDILEAGTIRGFYPHGLGHHLGLEVHDVSPHPPSSSSNPPSPFDFATAPLHTGIPPTSLTAENKDKDPSILRPGMVITIEPGIYFNAYLLENFFLNDEKHSQYVDRDVLKRYMLVGGVRVEDDILITKDGYENLTVALKGEEMLRCIRDGAAAEAR